MEPCDFTIPAEFSFTAPFDVLGDNIRWSSELEIPWIRLSEEHNTPVILCASGPSLTDSLPEIIRLQREGAHVVGMNGSSQWLKGKGVDVHSTVVIDYHPTLMVPFISDFPSHDYFIASQCDKSVFLHLSDQPVTLFHVDIPDVAHYIPDNGRVIQAVGGGNCVGMIAMSLMYSQGYRNIHLFGYDSSFRDGDQHVHNQVTNDQKIEVMVGGRKFISTPYLIHQAQQWQYLVNQLIDLGCTITVHGTGLLPYMAWLIQINQQESEHAVSR